MAARFFSWILGLTISMAVLAAPVLADGKRVALVIGNAAYKHAEELRNPRNDAQDIAGAFQQLGFTVISGVDLDQVETRRAIARFAVALEGATVAVFYYAGHGLQLNGTNYLVPTDSKLDNQYSPEFELVPVSIVQRVMESEKRTNILFLDAARENPLARNLARAMGARSAAVQRGPSPAEAGIGTIISFSTQPGNVAPEGSGRNSAYAAALVRQLRQPNIAITDMLLNVRREVMQATQSRQVPWEHSALTDPFYFSRPRTVASAKPAQAEQPAPAASARAQSGTERPDTKTGGGPQKKHAFVVGIDRYDNLPAHAQLLKAVGDSREMASTLAALGFVVTTVKEPTRGEFVARWHQFLEDVRPGDTLAFVFSGHGVEIEGANYLLMRDVPRVRTGREGQLRSESMSFGQILTDVRERQPAFSFVVLDACRDNPFEEGGRSVGGRRGLGRVEAPEGAFVMYSAGAGQKALDRLDDSDKVPTSIFTRTLLPLMRTPGLSLLDMADQVGEQVRSLALSTGHIQTPAFYSHVIGGRRVCLAGCDAPPPPAAPSSAAEMVRICREVEQVTSLTTLGVLELQHKGRPAGDCIAARIGELKANQTAAAEAERQRVALLSKASPPVVVDKSILTRRLYRELKRVGCDPGEASDQWTKLGQSALQTFAELSKLALHTDEPTQAALDAVAAQKLVVCPRQVAPAPTPVAKPVPAPEPVAVTPPTSQPAAPPAPVEPPKTAPRAIPRAAAVKPAPQPPAAPFATSVQPERKCRLETAEECGARMGVASSNNYVCPIAARKEVCEGSRPSAAKPSVAKRVDRERRCRPETIDECLKRTGVATGNAVSTCTYREICQ